MCLLSLSEDIFKESLQFPGNSLAGKFRKTQYEYALETAKFLKSDIDKEQTNVAILEAGTGVGKSMGYLIPLLLHSAQTGERVAVSTFSRHLQRQLEDDIAKAINIVKDKTHKNLTYAYRFGSDEYVRAASVLTALKEAEADEIGQIDILQLKQLHEWATISVDFDHHEYDETIHTGRISDFVEQYKLTKLPYDLTNNDISIRYYDSDEDRICHTRDIEASKEADLLIVTHHMLMIHVRTGFEILDSERDITSIVIDEADKISSAAEAIFESSFSINKNFNHFKKASIEHNTLLQAYDKYEALYNLLKDMSEIVIERPYSLIDGNEHATSISKAVSDLLKSIDKAFVHLPRSVSEMSTELRSIYGLRRELGHYLSILEKEFGTSQLLIPFVNWSHIYQFPNLQLKTINAGTLVARLFGISKEDNKSFLNRVIFTSATLSQNSKSEYFNTKAFETISGIFASTNNQYYKSKVITRKQFIAHDYGKLMMVLAPPSVPNPLLRHNDEEGYSFNEIFLKYVVNMTKFALNLGSLDDCHHRTVLLCASFREVHELCSRLDDEGIEYIKHEEGKPLNQLLEKFRESKNSVLVTPSAWEGFNERIANLIITRIPYMPVNAVIREKIDFIENKGMDRSGAENIIHSQLNFNMQRKMTQGFGRLIRTENDKGRLFIADPRFQKHGSKNRNKWGNIFKDNPHKTLNAEPLMKADYQQDAWEKATVLLEDGTLIDFKGNKVQ